MRGCQSIIKARILGYELTNVWVFLTESSEPEDYTSYNDPDTCLRNGFMPEIHIYSTDNLRTVDLRCLNGLIVHLVGNKPEQLAIAAKNILRFKPASIYACDGRQIIQHHTETTNDQPKNI